MAVKGKRLGWKAALPLALLACAGPFLLLPWPLYCSPRPVMDAGLFALFYVLPLLLSFFVPAWAARRGLPALVCCLLPTAGYLLLLVHGMSPVLWVLFACLPVAVVSASYGQERHRRAEKREKR